MQDGAHSVHPAVVPDSVAGEVVQKLSVLHQQLSGEPLDLAAWVGCGIDELFCMEDWLSVFCGELLAEDCVRALGNWRRRRRNRGVLRGMENIEHDLF